MNEILDEPKKEDERDKKLSRSIVMKSIFQKIDKGLEEKMEKESLYNLLLGRYGSKYEKAIAMGIGSRLYPEERNKYKIWQTALIILLLFSCIATGYQYFKFYQEQEFKTSHLIFMSVYILINLILVIGVIKFHGNILYSCVIIIGFALLNSIGAWFDKKEAWLIAISIIYLLTIILAYTMKIKLFPNLRYRGQRKMSDGSYMFTTKPSSSD